MSINLSYSAVSTYLTCGEKFRRERIEKIPMDLCRSALFFGKSCDQASEVIFCDKINNFEHYQEYSWERLVKVFEHSLNYAEFNGKLIDTRYNLLVRYSKADLDLRLLQQEDIKKIVIRAEELGFTEFDANVIEEFTEFCQGIKYGLEDLDQLLYNYIGYHCLYRKGLLLLASLKDWSDRNVKETISIQRYFEIVNDNGDKYRGLLDLEAVLYGKEGTFTLDLKTASNAVAQYPDNVIDTAMQLHSYAEVGSKNVGFIVLDKSIRVNEPRVRIREVYGRVTEEMLDRTFDKIQFVLDSVHAGNFSKNPENCFSFGAKCQHYSNCFPTGKKR